MKQFIVLAAILPILLVFIAQFTLEAVRSLRMQEAENLIRAFCIEVSYYDGGSAAEVEALKTRLAKLFRADANEVVLELSPGNDTAHIDWRISFPVGDIMAGGLFMGLSRSENRGFAQMSGTIVIAPKPPPEPPPPEPPEPPEPELPGPEIPDPELPDQMTWDPVAGHIK